MPPFSPLIWLYHAITLLLTPFWPLVLLWRLRKGKEDAKRWHERRGWPSVQRPEGALIWVHAASVGELNGTMPLIERLAQTYPALLVTTGTVTSARVAAARLPKGVIHQYIPLDCPRYVRRFFSYWKPSFGVMVESELWPNLLTIGKKMGCHFVLVNGRMSHKSFKKWRGSAADIIRTLLAHFDVCLCQSQRDADHFLTLGATRAVSVGNLKYDATLPEADQQTLKQLQLLTHKRPIIVAASTHPKEEHLILAAHRALALHYPSLLTIIIPRHPERGVEIAQMAGKEALYTGLRSRGDMPNGVCQIYVADTLGEMSLFYTLASLVFMGGSFVPHGGQNPIEPAQLKKPILTGPHTHNFIEMYDMLVLNEGAVRVNTIEEFVIKSNQLLSHPKARKELGIHAYEAIALQQGAVERTLQALEPYLLDCAIKLA